MTPITPLGEDGREGPARPNWREIDVVDLRDSEVALMTDDENRWCNDLLHQRHLKLTSSQVAAVQSPPSDPIDIDAADIAVMDCGIRILIYPGEGFSAQSFAGEIINPTERQMRGHGHVSCLWDRSKVVRLGQPPFPNPRTPTKGEI
jgi:hypothetical protein